MSSCGVYRILWRHQLHQYVNSGSPLASLEYPSYGLVVARQLPTPMTCTAGGDSTGQSSEAGFSGYPVWPAEYRPGCSLPVVHSESAAFAAERYDKADRRLPLAGRIGSNVSGPDQHHPLLTGLNRFHERAFDIITSPKAREAFDISKESPAFTKLFVDDPFSQSCLLAIRLIDAGVRFVSISLGGWDTHADNFTRLSTQLLPKLDAGLSSLLTGLQQRGLLDTTSLLCRANLAEPPRSMIARRKAAAIITRGACLC